MHGYGNLECRNKVLAAITALPAANVNLCGRKILIFLYIEKLKYLDT
jgi:hypothetical protein